MRRNNLRRILAVLISAMLVAVYNPVLAENDGKAVYFMEGHGEQSIDKDFKNLKNSLAQNNFNVKTLNLGKNKALPSDLDVLIILSPKSDLSTVEKGMISAYLDKGGKMMLLFDAAGAGKRLKNFEEITGRFNLLPGYDKVMENDTTKHVAGDCHTFIPNMPENVINKEPYDILVTETGSVNITSDNQDANVLPLLESSMESAAEPVIKGPEAEEGPMAVAAASEIIKQGSVSRMALLGSGKSFSDSLFSKSGTYTQSNTKYFIDILKWLTKLKVTVFSVGSGHCLAILSDGTLWAWGGNANGELGDGTQFDKANPVQIGKDKDWVKVSAGVGCSLAIKKDGSLWAWGKNDCGQLGDGTTKNRLKPKKVSYQKFVKAEAGWNYSLAIGANGTLWESGAITSDAYDSDNKYRSKFRQVGKESNWKSISISLYQAMALKKDGTLWRLGSPDGGTTISNDIVTWIRVGNRNDWTDISTGNFYTIAKRKDGTLWRMEHNKSNLPITEPVQVGEETDWEGFSAYAFTAAIKTDGTLWSWGFATETGTVMENENMAESYPIRIGYDNDWEKVGTGGSFGVALKSDGTLWSWGYGGRGQLGTGSGMLLKEPLRIGDSNDWAQVYAGTYHSLALKKDGTLWAWGSNDRGECGPTLNDKVAEPVQIGSDGDWQKIYSFLNTSFAIKKDGTLWAWGSNQSGEYGNGNKISSRIPVRTGNGSDWMEIAQTGTMFFGLKNDGTMWTWGNDPNVKEINIYRSPKEELLEPKRIGNDTDWKEIAGGSYRNSLAAIKKDGTIWACYFSNSGKYAREFNKISSDRDWLDIMSGSMYNVMLKADHSLWYDYNDSDVARFAPVRVGKAGEWKKFSTSATHVLAIKNDGSLWAFGHNYNAELGDGTYVNRGNAVRIGIEKDWVQVSAGNGYSAGIRSDGSLWGWGYNSSYGPEDYKTSYKSIPEEILFS